MSYVDAQGQKYSVSSTAYTRLIVKKSQLDEKEEAIKLAKVELASLKREIDGLRGTIDKTSQYQIDLFNDKVRTYNTKNSQTQIQIDYFNAAVDDFNTELIRVGTLIR